MKTRPYHFLLINLPFSSHMNATLSLIKVLIRKGHYVTVLMDPDFKEAIEKTGANFLPYAHYNSNWSDERKQISAHKSAYDTAKPILHEYDCLLFESIFVFGYHLAKTSQVPAVRLFSTFALAEDHLDFIRNTGGFPINFAKEWNPFYHLMKLYYTKHDMLETHDFFYEMAYCEVDLNIVFTSRGFQVDADRFSSDHYKFVGPVIRDESASSKDLPFSEMKAPIVYAAMGTILPKYLKKVYRKLIEAFTDFQGSLIMSVGENTDLEWFGDLPNHFYLYNRVPQIEVLKHADLFITHSGMNSINESLYFSVPMLASPMANDGPLIANQLEKLGAAKKINLSHISVNDLKQASYDVLHSTSIKKQVAKLSTEMQASKGSEDAAKQIEDYLNRKQAD